MSFQAVLAAVPTTHTILYSFRLAAAAMLVVVRDEADIIIWRGWEASLAIQAHSPVLGLVILY